MVSACNPLVRRGHDQLREWYGSPEPESGDRVSVYRPVADYLFNTLESFDPPSTPAVEIRVVPMRNLYVKSMVAVAVRSPFSQNPTGLVPQFNGTPVSTSEIGFTPAKKASSVRAFDNVESRKGYSGLYQFGASYNPGKFPSPAGTKSNPGNFLLYWMASQILWRTDPERWKGTGCYIRVRRRS